MRQVAAAFAKSVRKHVLPEVERFAPPPETRTDAADGGAAGVIKKVRRELRNLPARVVGSAADVVADRVTKHSKSEFKRLGIKLSKADPDTSRLVGSWRKANVDKVTSLIGDELDKLERILAEGEGRRPESLAKDIEERIAITGRKAELMARDQVLTLNSQISHHRMAAAGITRARWVTSGDERVRSSHQAMDGEEFEISDPPEVDGEKVLPGEPPLCRCSSFPILDELSEQEDDEQSFAEAAE